MTCIPAYAPFTPSNSGQRLLPTYYRGCWHVVSRSFLLRYRQNSSLKTKVYNPKTFFLPAALLRQGCPHCAIFPTAASRRSLGRVSVPMWPFNLSVRLPIVGLVSRYLTNYLIGREPIFRHIKLWHLDHAIRMHYAVLAQVSLCYSPPEGRLLTCYSPVRH